ncbi:MAG: L,D-transpeptidase family protein [Hyphomicrobiaceae bacterium]|nr:L,D-transpeptidase family protein [Hyphomicrobiaceae bacterium]
MAMSVLAFGLPVAAAVPAEAQYEPGTQQRRALKARSVAKPKPVEPPLASEGPLTLVVSLSKQRVGVYDKNGLVTSAPISSGTAGHRTPTGVFSILQKKKTHFSNLYAGAPMPNMQRITWSGVALHAGHLPGYPASHGCIRLPYDFSRKLFGITSLGTRVIVTNGTPEPVEIAHAGLLKPLPPGQASIAQPPAAGGQPAGAVLQKGADAAHELVGVSLANAAETMTDADPQTGQRTRASVAAARQRELLALEAAMASAEAARKVASEDLAAANASLREAMLGLRAAEAPLASIEKRMREALADKASADKALSQFLLKVQAMAEPAEVAAAEAEEDRLEAAVLATLAAYDAVAAEHATAEPAAKAARDVVATASEQRRAIAQRLTAASAAFKQAAIAHDGAKRALARADKPITVQISRKTGKLYVRQGYEDVLEADVAIEGSDSPIGTHVFIAKDYVGDGSELTWRAVTAATVAGKMGKRQVGKKKGRPVYEEYVVEAPRYPQTPEAALARVTIAEDVRARLAELIKPNSAIIITDEGKSNENGKYTDLIVLTR